MIDFTFGRRSVSCTGATHSRRSPPKLVNLPRQSRRTGGSPRLWNRLGPRLILSWCSGLAAACGLDPEAGELPPEASVLVTDYEEGRESLFTGMLAAALPAFPLSASTLTLADALAAQANVPASMDNPGCMDVIVDGAEVAFVMNGCTGPWGRVAVSGTVVASFSPGDGDATFHLTVASSELTIDGSPASHQVEVDVDLSGPSRSLSVSGSFEGRRLLRDVSHTVDFDIGILPGVSVSLAGSVQSAVGRREFASELELVRGASAEDCPEGTVVLERPLAGLLVTLTYDGTDQFIARTNRGGRGAFSFECNSSEAP